MIKIVLYLGHEAEKKFNYFRQAKNLEIYRTISKGNFVELTDSVEGWVEKVSLSETDGTKYVYILTDTEDEYNLVLTKDDRWELLDQPIIGTEDDE